MDRPWRIKIGPNARKRLGLKHHEGYFCADSDLAGSMVLRLRDGNGVEVAGCVEVEATEHPKHLKILRAVE